MIGPSQSPLLLEHKKAQGTDMHSLSGIRTCNFTKQAAVRPTH